MTKAKQQKGGRHTSTRTSPQRLLRLPEVEALVALKKSSIYAAMRRGTFPKRVQLGPKTSAWVESELQEWIAARIATRLPPKGDPA